MRTLLLSNINMQPLAASLNPWEVVCGEFNSILLDLINPESPAASNEFTHVLCLFDGDAALGEAFYGQDGAGQCDALTDALNAFCAAHPDKTVIANTFCFSSARWLNFADLLHPQSLRAQEKRLNERLIAIARQNPNLLLLDVETLFRRYGEEALLSAPFWYVGRIRYTNRMFRLLADSIRQLVEAYASRCRKVLVLDLDNTLWGGVVGETGAQGITLSEDGAGRCFRDFQRAVKALQRMGILLAICSKNNPGDLDEVFEKNSMMVLRREDFACIRANWEPKPKNLVDIAESLNLGLDSFVFIDDNPVEREMVAAALPEVAVPEFPPRAENLPRWLMGDIAPKWFGKYTVTAEDRNKTHQYRANEERQQLSRALNLDAFLEELQMECLFHIDPIEQIGRIAQLTQKTNQFNLTVRRYEIPEIRRFLESPNHAVLLLEYRDRFGSEGMVGMAIMDYSQARIDTLLMSCRVIGRKVEDRLLEKVCEMFRSRGLSHIRGEFVPARRNQQVAEFYDNRGFHLVAEEEDGNKWYERFLG